jgi:hypothetical protein
MALWLQGVVGGIVGLGFVVLLWWLVDGPLAYWLGCQFDDWWWRNDHRK